VDIDPTLALFTPLPNQDTLVEQNDALLKSYQDAAAMGTDVEKLQNDIDSLVRSMGLDVSNGVDADHFLAGLNQNGPNAQNTYNGVPNLNFNNPNNFNNMQDYGGFAGTNPTNSAVTTGAAGLSTPSGFPSSTTGFNTGTAGTGSHDDSSALTDGLPDEFDVDEFLNSLQKGVSEDGVVEGL
jgi:heat shock transcription factor